MFNKLLEMKAQAEHDILYARAKIEVVDDLLAEIDVAKEVEQAVEDEAVATEENEDLLS